MQAASERACEATCNVDEQRGMWSCVSTSSATPPGLALMPASANSAAAPPSCSELGVMLVALRHIWSWCGGVAYPVLCPGVHSVATVGTHNPGNGASRELFNESWACKAC